MKYNALINQKIYEVEIKGEGESAEITWDGEPVIIEKPLGVKNPFFIVILEGIPYGIDWQRGKEGYDIDLHDVRHRVQLTRGGVFGNRRMLQKTDTDEESIKAPMPGMVIDVKVEESQKVEIGSPLVILEAMKMENEVRSPVAGTVHRIKVEAGSKVQKDQPLIVIKK